LSSYGINTRRDFLRNAGALGAVTLSGCGSNSVPIARSSSSGLTTARSLSEAIHPLANSTPPAPVTATNGAQVLTAKISTNGILTVTTTNSNGTGSHTILTMSVNLTTGAVTYTPLGNAAYVLPATYGNTPLSVWGGSVSPSSATVGTYTHPSASGNSNLNTSTASLTNVYKGTSLSRSCADDGGNPPGQCKGGKPCPLINLGPGGWADIGVAMLGIIAGIVGFLASGVLAFAAGVLGVACGVFELFRWLAQ
jgi:hypothetical protein